MTPRNSLGNINVCWFIIFLFSFINSCACNWLWCSFILFLARYHLQYLNTSFIIFQAIDNKYIYNLHRGLLQFITIAYILFFIQVDSLYIWKEKDMNITERKVIHCLIRSFDFQIRSIITWAGFFFVPLSFYSTYCVLLHCVWWLWCVAIYSYKYIPLTSICGCNIPMQVLYLFC